MPGFICADCDGELRPVGVQGLRGFVCPAAVAEHRAYNEAPDGDESLRPTVHPAVEIWTARELIESELFMPEAVAA